jgi:hypothetical protein
MSKKSGSGMKNPDHISESLETIFWVKILKFFDVYPGSGMEKFGSGMEKIRSEIRDKHPGSTTLLLRSLGIDSWLLKKYKFGLSLKIMIDIEGPLSQFSTFAYRGSSHRRKSAA